MRLLFRTYWPWPLRIRSLLSGSSEARALPLPRERRQRSVVLTPSPIELQLAEGFLTTVLLDRPVDRGSLKLDRPERFRRVDVGERSLLLEPLSPLLPDPGSQLRLRYGDGLSPESVVFQFLTRRGQVDDRVEVLSTGLVVEQLRARLDSTRRALADKERLLAERESELNAKAWELAVLRARPQASAAVDFVLSGLVDRRGVIPFEFRDTMHLEQQSGLMVARGVAYRASEWCVVEISVLNFSERPFHEPASARLLRMDGSPVEVRRVRMKPGRLAHGEGGVIAIETGALDARKGPFHLKVYDTSGVKLFTVGIVRIARR